MPLPDALMQALQEQFGEEPSEVTLLDGGMISEAARLEMSERTLFAKWTENAPPRFFEAEADGLGRLSGTGTIRVPEVLGVGETFLILEYIEESLPRDRAAFESRAGYELAELHRTTIAPVFGLEADNYIGLFPQSNTPMASWTAFYRDCRLLPQIELARKKRHLQPGREQLIMRVVEAIERLLEGYEPLPALIHGDLWSGNFLSGEERPVFVDPSVSYSDREMEIAYAELFGGFPAGVLKAYCYEYPLDEGCSRRRPLYQLYHLLSHLNHFGEQYGAQVEAACRACLA